MLSSIHSEVLDDHSNDAGDDEGGVGCGDYDDGGGGGDDEGGGGDDDDGNDDNDDGGGSGSGVGV